MKQLTCLSTRDNNALQPDSLMSLLILLVSFYRHDFVNTCILILHKHCLRHIILYILPIYKVLKVQSNNFRTYVLKFLYCFNPPMKNPVTI